MKYYLSQEEKKQIIKLNEEGLDKYEIAKKLSVPYIVVEEVIKKSKSGNWVYEA